MCKLQWRMSITASAGLYQGALGRYVFLFSLDVRQVTVIVAMLESTYRPFTVHVCQENLWLLYCMSKSAKPGGKKNDSSKKR